jgi:probable addiction module antidote protein
MPKRVTDFREDLLADLSDPNEAACYLNAAFEDSEQMVLVALRDVAEARQMARVAEEAGVAREALYRMLNKAGNPTYTSLVGILNALGLKMVFAPAAPPIDRALALMSSEKEISTSTQTGIFGLASPNGPILQGAPKTGTLKGSAGGISIKSFVIEPWSPFGGVIRGEAAVAQSLHA